jgi:hypothetical protein
MNEGCLLPGEIWGKELDLDMDMDMMPNLYTTLPQVMRTDGSTAWEVTTEESVVPRQADRGRMCASVFQVQLASTSFREMAAAEASWPLDDNAIQAWTSPSTLWGVELRASQKDIAEIKGRVLAAGGLVSDSEEGAAAVFRFAGIS